MDKPRGRPFQPGNKFGRGRPKGSHNEEKSEDQRILDEYAPHLIRRCIALAMKGDRTALRLCMDRITAPRRHSYIRMHLPSIRQTQDINRAAERVTDAVRRGELTPSEGEIMMNLLESRSRVIERTEFEQRMDHLEQALADANSGACVPIRGPEKSLGDRGKVDSKKSPQGAEPEADTSVGADTPAGDQAEESDLKAEKEK